MTRRKGLVLDANILLRAVFGVRVLALLETYEEEVSFYSPDVCFDDARKYIPEIAKRRRIDPALGLSVLDQISDIVQSVDRSSVPRVREGCPQACPATRSRRLAHRVSGFVAGFSNLDRRSGFFWQRRQHLDYRPGRLVPSRRLRFESENWSGRKDLNLQPPGPEVAYQKY
jgi:hypothetical protein